MMHLSSHSYQFKQTIYDTDLLYNKKYKEKRTYDFHCISSAYLAKENGMHGQFQSKEAKYYKDNK